MCYGVVVKDKLVRVSFSRSVCQHLAGLIEGKVIELRVRQGRELSATQESRTGLYSVCKARTGWPLRVTFFKELADRWRHDSRKVYEAVLTRRDFTP